MKNTEHQERQSLIFKIIQSGEIIKIALTEINLANNFREIYLPLLKQLKLKQKDVYVSNEEGKMIGDFDMELSLESILNKFGNKLKLYCEKIF
ncbi:MAG: hypothetical protein ACFFCY_09065 [Promethearchaeota archaeon]